MPNGPYSDRTVLITGAASGIGAALAQAFADQGARLVLMDFDADSLELFSSSLLSAGARVLPIAGDVAIEEDCTRAVRLAEVTFGDIDILINNAGITQRGSFADTRIDVFRRVMDVNFFGSLYCTKAALPGIIRNKGAIVVMESIAGVAPLPGRTGYCASKHALHGLFTTLRTEVRKAGVHVMIVCPGFIRTNLQTRALGCDGSIAATPRTTVGKDYTPEMVADAVIRGLSRKTPVLALTPAGRFGYLLNRLMPKVYERMIEKKFSRECHGS